MYILHVIILLHKAIGQSTSLRGDGEGLVNGKRTEHYQSTYSATLLPHPAHPKNSVSRVQVTQLFLGGLSCSFEQILYNNSVAISTFLLYNFGKWPVDPEVRVGFGPYSEVLVGDMEGLTQFAPRLTPTSRTHEKAWLLMTWFNPLFVQKSRLSCHKSIIT